ncbi:DUF5986 family protein [Pediococcus ethanolidurans]|uniref:DUF5986 family protein n=1 Tax=Pediococcus ethanolidurans TaxID=319653 RepID=UPI001C1F017D|nr:DUF5986 family protein [Pediococcus ethanolidurans]MBU7555174.1 hypothetical protein [Pediococcus ethanolidurans]
MKPNPAILHAAVNVMSITDQDVLPNFEAAISKDNHDGLHQAVWAHRGQVITNIFADNKKIKILHIHRGSIWQFEAIADIQNKALYLLMTHDNLKRLQRLFKKEHYSTHYLFSLLKLNPAPTNEQIELFSNSNQEETRENDCENMLGELAGLIDQIYVVAFDYVQHSAVKGMIYLCDQMGSTIEKLDISDMLLEQNETNESEALGSERIKHIEKSAPLVKLKNRNV